MFKASIIKAFENSYFKIKSIIQAYFLSITIKAF